MCTGEWDTRAELLQRAVAEDQDKFAVRVAMKDEFIRWTDSGQAVNNLRCIVELG